MSSPGPKTIRVGTRRSALALAQTNLVIAALQRAHPDLTFEVHAMATMGDRDKTTPLPALGKGLWTSELEARLTSGEIDIIVHSLKDMPTTLPEGCVLACVTAREDPRDVVVFKKRYQEEGRYKTLSDLPQGSVVGTSSVRRAAQLRRRYPGLVFRDVRGNVETRLAKCDAEVEEGKGERYDALIIAAAGLKRLGYEGRISQYLDSTTESGGLLHAVGQGALGIEAREGDEAVIQLLKAAEDRPTMLATFAERAVMRTLEGGCSVPIGVETAWVEEDGKKKLRLRATVVSLDGKEAVDGEQTADVNTLEEAEVLGKELAQQLSTNGAQKILDDINKGRVTGAALKVSDV
ncbi:porphobilinogen deaminase-like protein [Thermochaetoides thermophila DSM 1495]|uniref:Porphobilinogen deaminase n=1 Tax=Chaetomium thermophilum (strain DSM 1495 / CBS 144.50 / IMI 039719) TaxID=759272 RepID=G0S786_CHATD|nr:porphobilinogen deaminase-like protein [Thermochaetoides thermophila DSM 1495]EGS20941.1 porphobilinogen deaminase-like protein [Thermochaetoides thermophila DSM 1495]